MAPVSDDELADGRLLVAGGDRVDAGKTTFTAGLVSRLRADGLSPAGFKPRAGNDWWFDHDDCLRALQEGRLYGKDVWTISQAELAGEDPPDRGPELEVRNPVHRLWRPTPGRTGLLGERGRTFLVDRVRLDGTDRFVRNGRVDIPDQVSDALPLADARTVESVGDFNAVMREWHLSALNDVSDRIGQASTAVVESYSDIAEPMRAVRFDAVAVVDPSRARIYDGTRWHVATDTLRGNQTDGQLEERVAQVTEMLEPLSTARLPPLTGAERSEPESIAEAYAPALNAIITATRAND